MTATDATPLSWQSGEGCAPYMIICDDEGFTWFDDGFEEVYTDFSDGDLFELSVSESNLAWSGCPSYVVKCSFVCSFSLPVLGCSGALPERGRLRRCVRR
jgi:hypothetical protein